MKQRISLKQTNALRNVMVMISGSVLMLTAGLILIIMISGHTKTCAVQTTLNHPITATR